jgi:hypothetical protein
LLHALSASRRARLAPAVCAGAAILVAAPEARALELSDPDGHFSITVDTLSARVCDAVRPGGWDPSTCERDDAAQRATARSMARESGGTRRLLASVVLRFDDWRVDVTIVRKPPDAGTDDDAALAKYGTALLDSLNEAERQKGWLWEATDPPRNSRIRGVETARFGYRGATAGIGGAAYVDVFAYEVRAESSSYEVTFMGSGREAGRLAAFADATMSTLDARPRDRTTLHDAGRWLVRTLLAVGLLAGGLVVMRAMARRKGKRSISPRDLWPTD